MVEFSDSDDVVGMANSTEMGLGSYIFTGDLQRGFQIAERLETGMVGLNTGIFSDPAAPFGGYKQSGNGRELGKYGLEEYLEVKSLQL